MPVLCRMLFRLMISCKFSQTGFVVFGGLRGIIIYIAKHKRRKEVVMMAVSNRDKQMLAEKTWLLYFNDRLYRDGIITADAYRKMILRINSRIKTVEEKKL